MVSFRHFVTISNTTNTCQLTRILVDCHVMVRVSRISCHVLAMLLIVNRMSVEGPSK